MCVSPGRHLPAVNYTSIYLTFCLQQDYITGRKVKCRQTAAFVPG